MGKEKKEAKLPYRFTCVPVATTIGERKQTEEERRVARKELEELIEYFGIGKEKNDND